MDPRVACISCGRSFSALGHPGLVRCQGCEDRVAFRLPASAASVTVFDTPGEAWA